MYLAEYAKPGASTEKVAVKLVKVTASSSEREEFLGEAEMMLQLDHPNIIKVDLSALHAEF